MKSVNDRVLYGINSLDRDKTPVKNWRSVIDFQELRFANQHKTIPAQLFGGFHVGRQRLRMTDLGIVQGFLADFKIPGDAVQLRKAWLMQLRTNKKWIGNTRMIKGLKFSIDKNEEGKYKIEYIRSGVIIKVDGEYTTFDSAKRHVRKMVTNKLI